MDNIRNLLNQVAIINKKHEELLDATGGRFNMFRMCGVNHYETTHSAIIAEFLNPKGSHGLKSKLLDCFIETLGEDFKIANFNCEKASVSTEHSIKEGRIDILIQDNQGKAFIIENKIYATDGWKQLERYDEYAKKTYKEHQILYLTLYGSDAAEQSGKGVGYLPISYEKTIIEWLEKCIAISARFPMVRETIVQYINHLKSLTHQGMDMNNKEEMMQLLCKPENVEAACAIGDSFTEVKNHLINKVFLPQLTSVCDELGVKNISGEVDRVNKSYAGFTIRHPSWKVFQIGFEFSALGLRNGIIGIVHIDGNAKRNDDTFEKLKPHFPSKNQWWVWKSFPIYTTWGKEAMLAIMNGDMKKLFKQEIEKILEITKGLDM